MILRLQTLMLKSLPAPMGRGAPVSSRRALSSSSTAWEWGTPVAPHSRGTSIRSMLALIFPFILGSRGRFYLLTYLTLAMVKPHILTQPSAFSLCKCLLLNLHTASSVIIVNLRLCWWESIHFHTSLPLSSVLLYARLLSETSFTTTVFWLRERDSLRLFCLSPRISTLTRIRRKMERHPQGSASA